MASLNTTNIGRIGRGLVVMSCVVDYVRGGGYYPLLYDDILKGVGGTPRIHHPPAIKEKSVELQMRQLLHSAVR